MIATNFNLSQRLLNSALIPKLLLPAIKVPCYKNLHKGSEYIHSTQFAIIQQVN